MDKLPMVTSSFKTATRTSTPLMAPVATVPAMAPAMVQVMAPATVVALATRPNPAIKNE